LRSINGHVSLIKQTMLKLMTFSMTAKPMTRSPMTFPMTAKPNDFPNDGAAKDIAICVNHKSFCTLIE
jgi:hypothetical protein